MVLGFTDIRVGTGQKAPQEEVPSTSAAESARPGDTRAERVLPKDAIDTARARVAVNMQLKPKRVENGRRKLQSHV